MNIALVTGANSGFGFLISLELLQLGFNVVATMRNLSNKEELIQKCEQLNVTNQLSVFQMDVTNVEEIETVKKQVEKQFGKLDVLVNNAGFCLGGFVEDLTIDEWNRQQETNVSGTFSVTKTFLPLLERSENGKIINMSSVSGLFGFPGMSAYCASKFALEGFSESLRLELLPKNIYVSLVEPASYKTNIWKKSLGDITINHEDLFKKQIHQFAINSASNASDPMEVAKLVGKIVQTKQPKFRYPIGKGAKTLALLKRLIPWKMIEIVVMKKLNIKKGSN